MTNAMTPAFNAAQSQSQGGLVAQLAQLNEIFANVRERALRLKALSGDLARDDRSYGVH